MIEEWKAEAERWKKAAERWEALAMDMASTLADLTGEDDEYVREQASGWDAEVEAVRDQLAGG